MNEEEIEIKKYHELEKNKIESNIIEKNTFPFEKSFLDVDILSQSFKEMINIKGVYPYKSYYLDVDKLINKAKKYQPLYNRNIKQILKYANIKLEKFDNKFLIIEPNPDFNEINWITDCFTEECRVKTCRREKDSETPFEYFNRNKVKIATYLEENEIDISFKNLNDFMEDRKGRFVEGLDKPPSLCSNYKLSFLLSILKHFKPKKWLDMSAGWGDRLIAAHIYGVDKYHGIDPNICLNSDIGYSKIIDYFKRSLKKYKTEAHVHFGVAETSPLSYDNSQVKYDFIFTSPPFFTFELYDSDNINQSTNVYPTIEKWLHNFLFLTIDRAWEVLEKGGKYLLYIEDKPEYPFIPILKKYMLTKKGCIYNGVIYQATYDPKYKKKPYVFHTVYCWTKK